MSQSSYNKNISLVDLGKFFFAICVIGIHTHAFGDNYYIFTYIFGLAVPFFFVSSGFFLGKKIADIDGKKEYRETLKRYEKRMLIPYLIWAPWYFFIEIMANYITEDLPIKEGIIQQARSWVVSSPGGGLWFVQVIVILVPLLMISPKKTYRYTLICLSLFLSMVPSIISRNINEVFNFIINARMFLWDGLFFLSGIFLGEKCKNIISATNGAVLLVSGLIFKSVLIYYEWGILSKITTMLTAIGLFTMLWSLKASYSMAFSLRLRHYSTIIYFTHITLKYAVQMGFKILHIPESTLVFIISSIVVITYAIIVEKYLKGTKFYRILYFG